MGGGAAGAEGLRAGWWVGQRGCGWVGCAGRVLGVGWWVLEARTMDLELAADGHRLASDPDRAARLDDVDKVC